MAFLIEFTYYEFTYYGLWRRGGSDGVPVPKFIPVVRAALACFFLCSSARWAACAAKMSFDLSPCPWYSGGWILSVGAGGWLVIGGDCKPPVAPGRKDGGSSWRIRT